MVCYHSSLHGFSYIVLLHVFALHRLSGVHEYDTMYRSKSNELLIGVTTYMYFPE